MKDVGAKTGFYTEFLEIIDDLNSLDGLVLCKAKILLASRRKIKAEFLEIL